jgi:hypothetical protein
MLTIDPGETESIAFVIQSQEDIDFCTCDDAAIKLLSYMNLEKNAVSVEATLKRAGHTRKLFPRQLEKKFRRNIETGKALRVQYKSLV